eukprot:3939961-Rhodomonas_salina.1
MRQPLILLPNPNAVLEPRLDEALRLHPLVNREVQTTSARWVTVKRSQALVHNPILLLPTLGGPDEGLRLLLGKSCPVSLDESLLEIDAMHLQVESCCDSHHDLTCRAARHLGERVDVCLPLLHLIAHHDET